MKRKSQPTAVEQAEMQAVVERRILSDMDARAGAERVAVYRDGTGSIASLPHTNQVDFCCTAKEEPMNPYTRRGQAARRQRMKDQQQPETLDVVTLTLRKDQPGALQVRGVGNHHEVLAFLNQAAEIVRAEAAAQATVAKMQAAESRIVAPG